MGPVPAPKVVADVVGVVEREESFDVTAAGSNSDTESCRRSRRGRRARGELRSKGRWAPF
ncbi:hypothetical protein L484_003102 [Morus notabilis]|uniref:Uncharacterized protein n=1 Tax=Morus notabilis TaxID=981085 RepID=W9S2F5_9ROSA|nr:hypothetical protein L484_003102 [Morus notabilis]